MVARPGLCVRTLTVFVCLAIFGLHSPVGAQEIPAESDAISQPEGAVLAAESAVEAVESLALADGAHALAVLPVRIHSSRSSSYLTESLADLLAARLSSLDDVEIIDAGEVRDALRRVAGDRTVTEDGAIAAELSDADLRAIAAQVGADAVVTGSVTELAGRFSFDVRVTPLAEANRSHTIVFTADSEEELLARLADVADRVASSASRGSPGRIVSITILGADRLEGELRAELEIDVGDVFDPTMLDADRRRLEQLPGLASVKAETQRGPDGVAIQFKVLPTEALFVGSATAMGGAPVVDIQIRGNRRIETGAILARIHTKIGEPLRAALLSSDVRQVFGTGFFRNVRVYLEEAADGVILVFEIEESAVVREITISGNEEVDDEKVYEILTLTTGSTLDYPLLQENVERIAMLYRAQGFFLADVGYELEEIAEGSIAIHFEVVENEKLKLREVQFVGNDAFTDADLADDFAIKTWRFYSWATSWFDKTGTYSEPLFMRDLQSIERRYSDAGYLQVEVGEPQVDAREDGLFVMVEVVEGPQFSVGDLAVTGDNTMDLDALRGKLKLDQGEVFNRSHLTGDVESLERHYTDRGFYFASVQPLTRLDQENQSVDVEFQVAKGPLYFVRHINVSGNTRTIDPIIRREMNVVEGQLYSARSLQASTRRIRNLGFFEDVNFEPKTTEDPAQLDLEVSVVERPTGSFSFGAGYSSQDNLVFTASLAQANLFGRGYGVNLSADLGGSTSRFFLSFSDPSVLDSNFSLGTTIFLTEVDFDDFKQKQQGFDINLGHTLNEDNTARGFLRYSFATRKIEQDTSVNASAPIFREILQGNESSSLVGISMRRDTRDDRFAPTGGTNSSFTLEYAGLGGFANFLRIEARHNWYLGAPDFLIDNSTFVVGGKIGYVLPLNTIDDYKLNLEDVPDCRIPGRCENVANLDQISRDLKLPLTERYFLGGVGTFQLRGFKARSVGPRRALLNALGSWAEVISSTPWEPKSSRIR
jgi:outer membrane protein insertion porin family